MKVWIAESSPPHEQGYVIGVYATEELAEEAKARNTYDDYIHVYDLNVITERPAEWTAE